MGRSVQLRSILTALFVLVVPTLVWRVSCLSRALSCGAAVQFGDVAAVFAVAAAAVVLVAAAALRLWLSLWLLPLLLLLLLLLLPLRLWLLIRLDRLLLKMLLRHGLTRLVAVFLGSDRMLLFCRARIAVPGILPLVGRQRCGAWGGTAVPLIPSASTLFPVAAPVITPAWRRIGTPAAKIQRGLAVVAHRNAQHIQRHIIRFRQLPRPVVPAARIPVVSLVDPVQAVVKEIIRIRSRVVVDGIARHPDEPRIRRHVDPDADAGKR